LSLAAKPSLSDSLTIFSDPVYVKSGLE